MTQTVLITGANRGIGLGLLEHYVAAGWHVHPCARDILDLPSNRMFAAHVLDVTDHAAIDALAVQLPDQSIDLLINNAGITDKSEGSHFGNIDYDSMRKAFEVNALATLKMTEALAPKIKDGGAVVNISTQMGCISPVNQLQAFDRNDPDCYPYRVSKAALNMVVALTSVHLAQRNIINVALHPGWVQTAMGGTRAPLTVAESVADMARVIANLRSEQSGKLIDHRGTLIPW